MKHKFLPVDAGSPNSNARQSILCSTRYATKHKAYLPRNINFHSPERAAMTRFKPQKPGFNTPRIYRTGRDVRIHPPDGRLKHKKREMKISLFYFIVAARRRLFGSGLFLFGRLGIFVKRIQFFDRNDFFFDLGLAQHEVDDFFFKHRRTQSFYRLGVFQIEIENGLFLSRIFLRFVHNRLVRRRRLR